VVPQDLEYGAAISLASFGAGTFHSLRQPDAGWGFASASSGRCER
jgi:hypothetical protein